MNIEKIDLVDADHVAAGTASFLAQAIEAKQPAQPEELTREVLWDIFVEGPVPLRAFITEDAVNYLIDGTLKHILSDRAATEARARQEDITVLLRYMEESERLRTTIADLERKIEHLEITKEEVEAATETGLILELRATIADLEKRLENAVEIDWSKARAHHLGVVLEFTGWTEEEERSQESCAGYIPRPTPAKLTPEQMARAVIDATENPSQVAIDLACGKSIETLYAEIKGGES